MTDNAEERAKQLHAFLTQKAAEAADKAVQLQADAALFREAGLTADADALQTEADDLNRKVGRAAKQAKEVTKPKK